MRDMTKVSNCVESVGEAYEPLALLSDPMSKRLFDIVLSLIGLIVWSPVWALISLLIWLEDGFPILLGQERTGRGGRLFNLYKFRSMKQIGDEIQVIEDRQHDSRVTRIGKVLRDTALDELPQLLNILKGDMSFVGPRGLPFRIEDHEKIRYRSIQEVEGYSIRSTIRPGLTGIAQIFARKDLPRRQKFRYDLLYIKQWSFWIDIKLILFSVWITLRGQWESRGKKV